MGCAGGNANPIVIGELIEDPAKRWKVTRLAAVGTAIAYEAVHTVNELARRREQAAKLAACKEGERTQTQTRKGGAGVSSLSLSRKMSRAMSQEAATIRCNFLALYAENDILSQ